MPFVSFVLAGLGLVGCANCPELRREATPQALAESARTDPVRLKAIERALGETQGSVFRRALQESVPYIATSPTLAKLMLKTCRMSNYGSRDAYTDAFSVSALAAARGESAQELVRSYRDGDQGMRNFLQPVLGRMGPEVRTLGPVLRQELATSRAAHPVDRIQILVLLACIGEATESETDEIVDAIRAKERPGWVVIDLMKTIGRNEWVNEKVKGAILKNLEEFWADPRTEVLEDMPLLWVLGTLGSKADDEVKKALAKTIDMGNLLASRGERLDYWYYTAVVSLAKVDVGRRKALLSALPIFSYENGEIFPLLEWQCAGMTEAVFVRDVTSLLASKDPRVQMQAANILRTIGPPARSATAHLLQLVENASDEEVRTTAAKALGMVAAPSAVPEMRRLSQKSEREVKRAIDESILAIDLGVVDQRD